MGLMIKVLNIMGVHWKIQFLGERCMLKHIFWGEGVNRLKRWALIVCRFKRGLGKKEKKKELCFWDGALRPLMHTMSCRSLLIDTNIQSKSLCNTVLLLIILTIIDTYFLPISKKKKKVRYFGKSLKL